MFYKFRVAKNSVILKFDNLSKKKEKPGIWEIRKKFNFEQKPLKNHGKPKNFEIILHVK